MNRLEQLRQFYLEDPGDPLNLYLLALEYRNTDLSESVKLFRELLAAHPDYLPAYFTTGEILYSINQIGEAREIVSKGIDLARQTGALKALSELQNLRSELEEE